MTTSDYLTAWFIYSLSVIGLSGLLYNFLAYFFPQLKFKQLLPFFVIMLTPYFSHPEKALMAPAIFVVSFEAVFGDQAIAIKALTPMVIMLALVLGTSLFLRLRSSRSN